MRTNYLWLIVVLLLAGCAGGPSHVEQKVSSQPPASGVEPDMSAAIDALKDGRPIVAEALLRGLVQRHPESGKPWVNIGLIYFRRGDMERAQQAAEKALELQPDIKVADYLLGLIAHQKNDAPQAQKYYFASLEKDQDHAYSHYNLALLYDTYYQDIEKALPHYRRYLELITEEDEETLSWVKELESQFIPAGGDDEG